MFDRGVVYRDPETFGEYHLSYRSGDIISPRIESYEPLGLELGDFVGAIRKGERMEYHTALARSVVRIVEAADQSLRAGGREIALEQDGELPHCRARLRGPMTPDPRQEPPFIHSRALVETEHIGPGTRIWGFAHVLAGAVVGADCNICDFTYIDEDVVIGDRVTIKGQVAVIDGMRIGDDVFIGPNATFVNDPFPRSKQPFHCPDDGARERGQHRRRRDLAPPGGFRR